MKAVIIDTFDCYNIRTQYVYNRLIDLGFDVTFIVSDFDHASKKYICIDRQDTEALHTKSYRKNLSVKRILSHKDFAKRTYNRICEIQPQVIYCMIPPNSLAKELHKYWKKHIGIKIYFDIFDLWPESLPAGNAVKKLLFSWKYLRNKHLECADKVFLECEHYKKFLPMREGYVTAYLCKPKRKVEFNHNPDTLSFVYLGSINNIIDIDGIVSFLYELNKKRKVFLHIIGKGEKSEAFKNALNSNGIAYNDYGAIYDEDKKDEIISLCHFGINMYKPGLCIGLTMKSIEYFTRGLPIINGNIFDTREIVDSCNCGFNVDMSVCIEKLVTMTEEQWILLHDNTNAAYEKYFSVERYIQTLADNLVE